MSLTPTIDRIPRPWQVAIIIVLSLAVVWGAGWFWYDLSASFLLVPTAVALGIGVPMIAIEEWKRRVEMKRAADAIGKCPACQYDLRAHNPGDKCPECGTEIPTEVKP